MRATLAAAATDLDKQRGSLHASTMPQPSGIRSAGTHTMHLLNFSSFCCCCCCCCCCCSLAKFLLFLLVFGFSQFLFLWKTDRLLVRQKPKFLHTEKPNRNVS
jgi:hypothetical protein